MAPGAGMNTYRGTSVRIHKAGAGRSRQGRQVAGILVLAVAILAAAALSSGGAVAAPGDSPEDSPESDALARARVDLAYCTAALEHGGLSDAAHDDMQAMCSAADAVIAELGPQPTPTPTASPTPTSSPTTPPVTTPPPPAPTTPPPTTSPPVPAAGFPTPTSAGTPPGWVPATTRSTDLRVTAAGSVVQDVRFTNGADLLVDAANVTIRRVELQGGRIDNVHATCRNGLRIEQTTVRRAAGTVTDADQEGAVGVGGYTADRVFLDRVPEGFRVGGYDDAGCGPVTISNSFIRIRPPDVCGTVPSGWHGDGVQGFDGPALTIRNVTIDFDGGNGCGGGTASFFYPRNQGNTSADVDRLLINNGGEGIAFRLGMPGRVVALRIVNNSWFYGPISVRCSVLSAWEAQVVTVDASWSPTFVRTQPCNSEGGT